MRTQIIQDHNGLPTGVFIPIEDWENMKKKYPDIDKINEDVPQWQKDILDRRLNDYKKNPVSFKPINEIFDALDREL